VKEWKKTTDRVHAKGGAIFTQLWALGRANGGESGVKVVSAGDIKDASGTEGGAGGREKAVPTPLTNEDIKRYQKAFADSSKLAIEAGMDGIELHGARKSSIWTSFGLLTRLADGYLIDQFTQSSSNNRTDQYGGSIENRIRFALETLQACSDAIGQERVGIRLSPYSHFQGMSNPDNVEVFTTLCQAIHDRFPNLGYVHMVESRGDPAKLANWATESGDAPEAETLNPFRKVFEGSATAFLSAGGYTADLAREVVKTHGGAVVFGRIFISSELIAGRSE
jgi:2,4-dienoyl-CoA reductase-like NADH-dependent reductase (Old Yellow Enzyme family)